MPFLSLQSKADKMSKSNKIVSNWLLLGVVLVFFQVVIGGVTRLTDSGLSITEWSVIQGTLPPLNAADWDIAFEKYKVHASKQFESLHAEMTMSEFKVIFFWEYFHRLWARMMGFVFLFPFLYFISRKMLPKRIIRRLGVVILLAMAAATFGWIMVKSGLNDDQRTWVSAYKLIIHLGIATTLIAYLYKTYLISKTSGNEEGNSNALNESLSSPQPVVNLNRISSLRFGRIVLVVLFIQILFGGLMAGMRAGLLHPHFPMFVNYERLQLAFASASAGFGSELVDYEPSSYIKAYIQVFHRSLAYGLVILSIWFSVYLYKRNLFDGRAKLFLGILGIQFLLGVLTVINCLGSVPIFYGAAHQAVALILLLSLLRINHFLHLLRG